MASISENLQNIIDSKTAIKSSIANKGVTVPAEAKLNALPALIDSIEQGGGGVSSGAPEIVDVVFVNPVENAESTDIDVVVRIMSNGVNANYGVQYRPVGTANWIEGGSAVITDNTDVKTLHGFDKIATVTITGLLYQQSWDTNLGALRENNNRYEVRAYIAGTTNNYTTPRIYATGWTKYFDNIYEAANDLELGDTKKKRAIAVIHSANLSTTLSQLGGDYFKTSDGYLGVSENHIFKELQDIPIYFEDGINIKYYVRWVIIYTNVATANITINDYTNKNYLYCYFGNCTPSLSFGISGNSNPSKVEGIRFSLITNVTSISNYAFYNCSSLTSIIIPNSVTSIGSGAFQNCYSLASIIIPNSVTSIGNNAFQNCSSLTSITIPNSVITISGYAFTGCPSLASIIIPNSITSIGNNVFQNCYALASIIIPNSVTSIGSGAFYGCYALTSIIIPNSVRSIGNNVFYNCYSLTSIIIPNSVTSIGSGAFQNCYSLASIIIPNSVTSIGNNAFQNCSSLTSITIPNSVITISGYAFTGCPSLASIIIPNSVTSIGSNAFQGCYSLTSITIPNSVTSIGNSIFQYCYALTSITFLSIQTTFPTTSILDNTRKVYNVTLPSGWNKTANLVASTTAADCVLTHRCMLDIFNKLSSSTTGTLTLGTTNLARMSAAEISIATNKGWTVN